MTTVASKSSRHRCFGPARSTISAFAQLAPSREQLLDKGRGLLPDPIPEAHHLRERLLPGGGIVRFTGTELHPRIVGDISEIPHGPEIAETNLPIGWLPAGDPPVQPVLGAISGGGNQHRRPDRKDVVLHPTQLAR